MKTDICNQEYFYNFKTVHIYVCSQARNARSSGTLEFFYHFSAVFGKHVY